MQDLLAFVVVMIVTVGGAEVVRATCRRQLSAPLIPSNVVPVRVESRTSAGAVLD